MRSGSGDQAITYQVGTVTDTACRVGARQQGVQVWQWFPSDTSLLDVVRSIRTRLALQIIEATLPKTDPALERGEELGPVTAQDARRAPEAASGAQVCALCLSPRLASCAVTRDDLTPYYPNAVPRDYTEPEEEG